MGSSFAKTLSEAGARVILAARRTDNLRKLQSEISGESHVYSLDVTSKKSVNELFQNIKKEIGSADILINNAGVSDTKKFKDMDEINETKIMGKTI